jgi:para-aminobenzoate synthetase component 1
VGIAGLSTAPDVTLLDPAPEPLDAFRALRHLPFPLLLESGGPVGPHARYTYLMADPVEVLTPRAHPRALDELRDAHQRHQRDSIPELPPFQGGLAGYLSYELGASLEGVTPPDGVDQPGMVMGLYRWVIAWDRVTGECWQFGPGPGASLRREAAEPVTPAKAGASRRARHPRESGGEPPSPWQSTFARSSYESAVQRVRDYILAGDVFQVNLSQRFTAPSTTDLADLYGRLRSLSPAPFSACFDAGDHEILSISPELFLALDGQQVETRPIKGTRPRGQTAEEDIRLARELEASAKDRAENVMIVDLLRNDLSRVAQPGSVEVPALCALESHPTVHHLVSTVTARLAPGVDAIDLLTATLPGGSITGAPKVRAMEIIRELEPVHRGAYCGGIGYIGASGDLRMSVAIRTMIRRGGVAHVHAGGGIVLDSDPAMEYEETLHKARALLEATAG